MKILSTIIFNRIVVICWGGCLLLPTTSDHLFAQHAPATANAQRGILWSWLQQHPPAPRLRMPLVVFTTSYNDCSQCCAASVNALLRVAQGAHLRFRPLVVVATDVPKEGLALRRYFPDADVTACSEEQLRGLLPIAPGGTPSMFVIDPNGEITARFHHFQTHPLPDALVRCAIDAAGITAGGIELKETDSTLVGSAGTPLLSRDGNQLSLLELRQNRIQTYDTRTGVLLHLWAPSQTLGKYYRKAADTMWEALAKVYSPLVTPMALFREPNTDTIPCWQ
ncbi:MAG: hypothetical protein JST22_07920 [Bacteroidetes bacterium]|nr:hypothetical protein [Bacteroidota bacterium]